MSEFVGFGSDNGDWLAYLPFFPSHARHRIIACQPVLPTCIMVLVRPPRPDFLIPSLPIPLLVEERAGDK